MRKAVVLVVEMGEETTSHNATTIDISQQGARVRVNAELKAGQVLRLIRPDNPDDTVRCLVVWAAEVGSDGPDEAGLEFLQPFSSPLEC